jgi:hypothetical protein
LVWALYNFRNFPSSFPAFFDNDDDPILKPPAAALANSVATEKFSLLVWNFDTNSIHVK